MARARTAIHLPPPECVDCGAPAEVWRDIGAGTSACRPCETKKRFCDGLANIGPPDGYRPSPAEVREMDRLLQDSMRPTDPKAERAWLVATEMDHRRTARENGDAYCHCATCDDARRLVPALVRKERRARGNL
jgi:hypothetical protein